MMSLSNYEDLIELKIELDESIDLETLNWVRYNPRKPINRWGCSITSLDGDDSGMPDLDSVREYNIVNKTNLNELSFKKRTLHSKPFSNFLDTFECGRSHYLKFGLGGFFPWHRDNDQETFRIIYTVKGCSNNDLIWLQDEKLLHLQDKKWYYVNTKKKHCVFSFTESIMAVFNVALTDSNIKNLFIKSPIK